MKKAVFLDRDGVINRKAAEGKYITRWKDVQFLPRVPEAVTLLNRAGFSVIVVSNQRCVAKGLITLNELDVLNQRISRALAATGAIIDDVYCCPHEMSPACDCRKPAPGMLLKAAREHHVNLAMSWMIGDSTSDVTAGKRAGCKTARLQRKGELKNNGADVLAHSLLDAVNQILLLEAATCPKWSLTKPPSRG